MAFDNPSLFEVLTSIRLKVLRELVIFSQQFSDLSTFVSSVLVFLAVGVFILNYLIMLLEGIVAIKA
ncbi:hypothetical protein CXF85_19755 [Colwellia sp. 75C3]|uniref:hypothetical protein n=1 Tax=Colwellia sp. 75C3 TaxID=888425 RepID=UPI000C33FB8E|nr:hypothetical protein [Colwellia sp. 75C3]PKG81002.1 hypothetical protein CXF85_19755 [Colwellia sp. 75C3]